MKIYKILLLSLAVIFASCADENLEEISDQVNKGGDVDIETVMLEPCESSNTSSVYDSILNKTLVRYYFNQGEKNYVFLYEFRASTVRTSYGYFTGCDFNTLTFEYENEIEEYYIDGTKFFVKEVSGDYNNLYSFDCLNKDVATVSGLRFDNESNPVDTQLWNLESIKAFDGDLCSLLQ